MLPFFDIKKKTKKLENILKDAIIYLNSQMVSGTIELKKIYKFSVSTRYGDIDKIEFSNSSLCSVSIFNNFRKSFISSNVISLNFLKKIIDKSILISKYTERDKYVGLPNPELLFQGKKIINLFFPWSFSLEGSIKLVKSADFAACSFHKDITNTEGSCFESFIIIKVLGNSYEWIRSTFSTYNYFSSCVIASNNKSMERDYSYSVALDFRDLKDPEIIGLESAQKSIAKLNSVKLMTKRTSVIFKSDISAEIFGYLADALSGYLVYQKTTFLLNFLKKQIFPKWLEIYEDPIIKKGLFSKLFDSEGVTTSFRKIINRGCITTWLLDTYTSNQLFLKSTGHSGGIHNWIISSRNTIKTYKEQLNLMDTGVLVTELFGNGINLINGDYSQGACGFWVQKGEIQYPISEITISGNLKDMWKNIISISDDFQCNGSIKSSSILIPDLQISGR